MKMHPLIQSFCWGTAVHWLYTVYSYWLVTCEVQIEVWSCYYYKCLTVLLQCPVFTTPLLASIHCKNGELYQMGNLIIYSNIIYSPPFSGQLPGVLTIWLYPAPHLICSPWPGGGWCVCTVQYVIPTISTIQNPQQKSWATFKLRCKKWRILIFPPFSRRACWRGSRGRWRSPAAWSRSPRPPPSSPRAGSTGCPDLARGGGVMYLSIVWHLLSLYSCTWQGFSLINRGLQW